MLDNIKGVLGVIAMANINIFLVLFFVGHIFGWSETIVAGVISFLGALLSGLLTLAGVMYTINQNEKVRKKNEYPSRIDSIEKMVKSLDALLEDIERNSYLPVLPSHHVKDIESSLLWFKVTNGLELELKRKYLSSVDIPLKEIRQLALNTDAKTFNDFLHLKQNIELAKAQGLAVERDELNSLCEEIQIYDLNNYSPFHYWKDIAVSDVFADKYKPILIQIRQTEEELTNAVIELLDSFRHEALRHNLSLIKAIK